MLHRKYSEGHILVSTVCITDIFDVAVVDRAGGGGMVMWPSPLKGFGPTKNLAPFADEIFIRDLIEAMTSYEYYNFDDCIRKIVTSVENCFLIHYKLPDLCQNWIKRLLNKFFLRNSIRKLINQYVKDKFYVYSENHLSILRSNFKYIYHLRNQIVHNKLRMDSVYAMDVCRKAVKTVLYIYQGSFIEMEKRAYIFSFYRQFNTIDLTYSGTNLDMISAVKDNVSEKMVKNREDLDSAIFNGLRIGDMLKKDLEEHCQHITIKPNTSVPNEVYDLLGRPYICMPMCKKKEHLQ